MKTLSVKSYYQFSPSSLGAAIKFFLVELKCFLFWKEKNTSLKIDSVIYLFTYYLVSTAMFQVLEYGE